MDAVDEIDLETFRFEIFRLGFCMYDIVSFAVVCGRVEGKIERI